MKKTIYNNFDYLSFASIIKQPENVFKMLPLLNRSEVNKIYLETKLVISPNLAGGGPIEAAGYGCPFVGYQQIPEVIEDFKDFLVGNTLREVEMFQKKLLLNKDFYLKTSYKYQEYAFSKFSYESFISKLCNILESI
jgi:glycosyltransferase involved in cell wall biosynthesis